MSNGYFETKEGKPAPSTVFTGEQSGHQKVSAVGVSFHPIIGV